MELVNQNFFNMLSGLTTSMKKAILMTTATSVGFLFYKLFLKKKAKYKYLGNGKEGAADGLFNLKALQLMKKKMKLRRSNISQMSSRIDNKKRKLFMFNTAIKNLEKGQNNLKNKADQVFFNIAKKFSVFVVKNKFAFA